MKYFSLFEISRSFIVFFVSGITSYLLYYIGKTILIILSLLLNSCLDMLTSALTNGCKSNKSVVINKSIFSFFYELTIVFVVAITYFVLTYYFLDGALRLFSVLCFFIGFMSCRKMTEYIRKIFYNRLNFPCSFIKHFLSLFFKILFTPIEIISHFLRKQIMPILNAIFVKIAPKRHKNVEHNSQNSILFIKRR